MLLTKLDKNWRRRMEAKSAFWNHLDRSSEIVKDWPSWKQRVPDHNYSQSTKSAAESKLPCTHVAEPAKAKTR
jgi:hypothetical protein